MNPRICLFSLALACCQLESAELLAKFDFEDGRVGPWSLEQRNLTGSLVFSVDENESHSGKYSLRVKNNLEGAWRNFYASAPLGSAGTRATFRGAFFVKGRSLTAGDVVFSVLENESGKPLGWAGKEKLAEPEITEAWTRVTFSGELRARTSSLTLFIRLSPRAPSNGVFWIDDLHLEGNP